jgi:glucokinase
VPHRVTRAGAPIACVGAGTGLGESFMTAGTDGVYEAWPTEGGHAEFAPRTELQVRVPLYAARHLSALRFSTGHDSFENGVEEQCHADEAL